MRVEHSRNPRGLPAPQAGFSLIEMMMVLVIFMVVSAAVFGLLNIAQVRYRAEQEFVDAFQGARLAVDQIAREIHLAGYPPPSTYTNAPANPATAPVDPRYALGFFGLPFQTCQVGMCAVPSGWDLVIEADLDPGVPPAVPTEQVEWIRYWLVPDPGGQTSTLMRAVVGKAAGGNPTTVPGSPFIEGVLNVPGVPGDEIFRYVCDPLVAFCSPQDIVEVQIVVRARSMRRDIQTQQFRELTLQGIGRRINPYP
ncbi:MAG: PilW family protein [Terriglobia bacterium]